MSATRKPAPSAGSRCECGHRHSSHQFTGVFPLGRCGVVCECACTQYHRAESGAPLQPGATQPEHEGVAHDNENFSQCTSYFHECRCLLSRYHAGRHRDRAGISAICWNDNEATERTFTHSELTTLLERMARLVVQEAANEGDCEFARCEGAAGTIGDAIIAHFTKERIDQLREAVERP